MNRVDAHTHAFPLAVSGDREAVCVRDATFAEMYADPKAKLATVEQVVAAMDVAGFDAAAIAGFAFAGERDIDAQNEDLLRQRPGLKGRYWQLATLNLALPGWRRTAERAVESGACGFGELRPHNQGWDPVGSESRALCALAREAGVPLLWHVSEPVGHAYAGKRGGISPVELIELATLEPGTTMIAAHLGGGLAYYLQMPEVKTQLEGIYFDTAAASLLYDERTIPRLVDLAGPGRVLFASDYPLQSPRRQLERVLAVLPPEHVADICGRNAERLFARDS